MAIFDIVRRDLWQRWFRSSWAGSLVGDHVITSELRYVGGGGA